LLNKHVLLVNLQGLYPDHHTDVEVLNGDYDASKIDALTAEPRAPAGDEVVGEGISSTEPIALGPIRSSTLAQANPFIVDRVVSSATGGQKWKRPPPVPKRKPTKPLIDQVMI
jgi:hypothetical protein